MIYSSLPLESIDYKKYVIIFDCLIYCIVSYFNFRQYCRYLIRDRPKEWIDIVTDEEFKKTQSYNLDKSRFTFIQDLVKQVATVTFWYYDGFAQLWDISGYLLSLCFGSESEHQIIQALVYDLLFRCASRISLLPFSMYSSFILDKKHGFDKATLGSFFYDNYIYGKIVFLFMTPTLAASLWVGLCAIWYSGDNFYIYVILISLAIEVPSALGTPIFSNPKRLDDDDLQSSIRTLAERVGFPLKNIYVVDGCTAMVDHSKAYIYGYGKNQHIVLYDLLVEDLEKDEICAVVAHELGHWKMGITTKKFAFNQLDMMVTFWLLSFFIINNDTFYHSFGFHSTPIFIGHTLFQALYAPIRMVINFGLSVFIHQSEYKADAFALDLGYTCKLRSALIKSSATKIDSSLTDRYNVDPWYSTFQDTCPTLTERLDRLGIKPISNKPIAVFEVESKKDT